MPSDMEPNACLGNGNSSAEGRGLVDLEEVMARVGGDRDLLRDLCDVFVAELPGMIAGLQKAIENGDGSAISRAAHGLKGAIGVFGKGAPFHAALAIEMAGKEGRIAEASSLMGILCRELERLKAELNQLAHTK